MSGSTAYQRITRLLAEATNYGPEGSNGQRDYLCPAHDDATPSLSVTDGGDRVLIHCQAGCDTARVLEALKLQPADLFDEPVKPRDQIVATYDYVDEHGKLLFQAVRMTPKSFRQRCRDSSGGWEWKLGDTRRVLYRLPQVLQAVAAGRTIFVVEGEKDVHALEAAGETATTNPMGAGKWRPEYSKALAGAAEVVIVADRDQPGIDHAKAVLKSLESESTIGHLLIVEAKEGKDAADHLAAGHPVDELQILAVANDTNGNGPDPVPSWNRVRGWEESSAPAGARLTSRPASGVKVIPPVWLWQCWMVAGAVQLLVGRQGSGKSTFAAWVVAQLTSGRAWPGETGQRDPLRCGMLSLEEPDERLVARLVATGAVLDSVDILGDMEDRDDDGRPYRRPWRLPGDCAALEAAIRAHHLAAVTIDGLGYSIGGDSHNYANVGAALSALAGVAERTGCCILGLTHPPKGNSDAVTAAIGSTAWTAVARISWVMGGDPTDETGARRVIRPAPGSNYRLPERGLSFTIGNHDETEAGYVTGLQASDVAAETITSPPLPRTGEEASGDEDASSALAAVLADGAVWVKVALESMSEAGFTKDQARRAKDKIARSIKVVGKPGDPEQGWKWELLRSPEDGTEGGEDGTFPGAATFATFVPSSVPDEDEVASMDAEDEQP